MVTSCSYITSVIFGDFFEVTVLIHPSQEFLLFSVTCLTAFSSWLAVSSLSELGVYTSVHWVWSWAGNTTTSGQNFPHTVLKVTCDLRKSSIFVEECVKVQSGVVFLNGATSSIRIFFFPTRKTINMAHLSCKTWSLGDTRPLLLVYSQRQVSPN